MAAFWACACKLSWTLLSPARVQSLCGAGRKGSSGTGLGSLFQRPREEEKRDPGNEVGAGEPF